jgi:beta-lactamase regulating signal transducer with metallopeptidase domain/outer membrane biosynthesis protein TonB
MLINFITPFVTFFIIYQPNTLQLTQPSFETSITHIIFTQSSINNEWYSSIIEYFPYLTVFWLSVIFILSLKLFIELYSVTQLPKNNVLIPDDDLYKRFEELASKIGLQNTPRLLLSLNTHVPMAIGWIKPMVLLPVSMLTGLTPTQLDMLMLHELAHIRRYDYFINFIQSIVEIILFFHPAVLWVSNQMRNEREYCSDDIAVKYSGNPIAYAHTLADTATLCNKHRKHSIPNMAMAASGGDLTQRVLRLVNNHHCASSNQVSKWFAALIILSVVLLSSSQQLVNLLKLELNAASYTPTIEVLDHPLILNNEVLNDEVLNTKITETAEIEITTTELQTQLNTPLEQSTQDNGNEIQLKKVINETHNSTLKTLNKENNIPSQKKQNLSSKHERTLGSLSSEIESKLTATDLTPNEVLVNQSDNTSLSELAFKKTDASFPQSPSYNAYAKELLELNSSPVSSNTKNIHTLTVGGNDNLEVLSPHVESSVERSITSYNDAELIFSIPPKYPVVAKRKGIEIELKVQFMIGKDGYVKDLVFPAVKRHRNYFKSAVRNAMEKWRFKPATYNGEAVESEMAKIFSFSLHQ